VCVLSKAYYVPVFAAMESINNLQMHLNDGGFSTPIKKASVPLSVSQMLPLIQLTIHDGAYWFIFYVEVFIVYT
jgi:hypothetical protein